MKVIANSQLTSDSFFAFYSSGKIVFYLQLVNLDLFKLFTVEKKKHV
jgi:hypothetical protein